MVGVIKSKGPQTQTKAAGVLRINTGEQEVAGALSRAADRVGQVAFQEFKYEQEELGRNEAKNFIPERDENNNLVFTDPTQGMSRIAKNSARPIIEETYARQLGIDFKDKLLQLRQDVTRHGNDPVRFQEQAQIDLAGIMDAIPPEFALVGQGVLNNVASERTQEHVNQLTRQKIQEEEQAMLANIALDIADDVNTISALMTAGDFDIAYDLADNARVKAGQVMGMGGNLSMQKALVRSIDTVVYGEQANKIVNDFIGESFFEILDPLAESFEGNAIVAPDREIVHKGERKTVRQILEEKGVTDDFIQAIDDVEVRGAVAAAIRTRANQYSQRMADNNKALEFQMLVQDQMSGTGFAGTGKKQEDALNSYLTDTLGISREMLVGSQGAAMARDPNSALGKMLRNGTVIPTDIKNQLVNAATGLSPPKTAEELGNLLTLWSISSMGVTSVGPVVRDKLGKSGNSVNAFWANVNNYAQSYGLESAVEYAATFTSNASVREDMHNSVKQSLGNPNKSAYAQIKERWIEEEISDDWNASSLSRLESIAIRAYASLPKEEADQYMQTAYETIYAPTDYIRLPSIMGGAKMERSEFAPERYYPEEIFPKFLDHVNKKLATASKKGDLILGETAFLYPAPSSTSSSVTWQVVDKRGQAILNSNGQILVRSQELNRDSTMANAFREGFQSKINAAVALRDREIRRSAQSKDQSVGSAFEAQGPDSGTPAEKAQNIMGQLRLN